jgi:hypothetical protein
VNLHIHPVSEWPGRRKRPFGFLAGEFSAFSTRLLPRSFPGSPNSPSGHLDHVEFSLGGATLPG